MCNTYPPVLVVPSEISDSTLYAAARFRSKGRLSILSYLYGPTQVSGKKKKKLNY